ncbi:MAG TPA: caspase family protein [Chryseosolibacter sp.]|nr:caspase family protein [Chryseosolibacter sp.]
MSRILFSLVLCAHLCHSQSNLKIVVPANHSRPVTALTLSPDDRFLFSGSSDRLVKLWSVETGKLLKTYDEIASTVRGIHVSSSGKYFVTIGAGLDGLIRDVSGGQVLDSIKVYYNKPVIPMKNDEGFYWLGETKKINHWKPGSRAAEIDPRSFVKIELSADGAYLLALAASGDDDFYYDDFTFSDPLMAVLFNTRTGVAKQLRKVKGASGKQLGFSSDGKTAFVGDDGNTVYAFSTVTAQSLGAARNLIFIDEFQTSATSNAIRVKCYDGWKIWDFAKGTVKNESAGDAVVFLNAVTKFDLIGALIPRRLYDSLSNFGDWAFSAEPYPADTSRVVVPWSATRYDPEKYRSLSDYLTIAVDRKNQRPLYVPGEIAVPFNRSARLASAVGSRIILTNLETGKPEKILHGLDLHPSASISFSRDNRYLTYGGRKVSVWDLQTGKASYIPSDSGAFVTFGPANTLVAGSNGKIEFFDARSGKVLHSILSAPDLAFGAVTDIQISGDSRHLLWRDQGKNTFTKKMNWNELTFYPQYKQLNSTLTVSIAGTQGAFRQEEFPGTVSYAFSGNGSNLLGGVMVCPDAFYRVSVFQSDAITQSNAPQALLYPNGFRNSDTRGFSTRMPVKISASADSKYAIAIAPFPKTGRYGPRNEQVLYFLALDQERMPGFTSNVKWMAASLAGLDVAGYSTSAKHITIKPLDCSFHPSEPLFAVSDQTNLIRTFSAPDYSELKPFVGHNDQVVAMAFSSDGKWLASASRDNTVKIWDVASRKELASLITFGDEEWVVLHASGLFDASAGAMAQIYFTSGTQTIGLEQIKERFYEPNLIRKILGGETLRSVSGLERIDLFPGIEAILDTVKAQLTIRLQDQGGGIGKTSLFINGKEAIEDIRSFAAAGRKGEKESLTVDIDLSSNKHLVWGDLNFIGVKSHNEAGYLASPVHRIFYTAPAKTKMLQAYTPHLYGLIVGVSDYENDQLDLKYSSKDATDFHTALLAAGRRLFEERIHITLLHSESDAGSNKPLKRNIIDALESIAAKAQPNDVLVMYFSGHGTSQSGEDSDFLYLTPEARGFTFSDPVIRESSSISGSELTGYLKSILAQKQVLIFDACASGKVVDNMLAKRDVPSSTLRALERMKDRAGTYILTGCAADAVSYEATQFGQGLLTYSVLSGIRGGALREDRYLDVLKLFNYAKEEVPKLAGHVGGIQEPKVFSPYGAESFDLGIIEAADRKLIPLTEAKPFFVRSSFQNETKMRDDLGVGKLIDEGFSELANQGKAAPIIFLDTFEFPGSYTVTGRYQNDENGFSVKFILYKNDVEVRSFERKYDGYDPTGLRKDVIALVVGNLPSY